MNIFRNLTGITISGLFVCGSWAIPLNPLKEITLENKYVRVGDVVYDCADMRRDSDEFAAACKGIDPDVEATAIGSRRVLQSYDEVMERFTPYLEEQYDMFIIANTAERGQLKRVNRKRKRNGLAQIEEGFVPAQRIVIVRKSKGHRRVFKRDGDGRINGLDKPRLVPGVPSVIKTSSGANYHMRSYSGILQVHTKRSRTHRRKSWEASMSNALYFGYIYTDSASEIRRSRTSDPRYSYSAMHGTPGRKNHNLLGQRASHGCLRIHPKYAEKIYPVVMSSEMDGIVPKFDWLKPFPSLRVQNRNWLGGTSNEVPKTRAKKVLFIIFNGYGEHESRFRNPDDLVGT